jgi:hypothetical protein
MTDYGPGDMVEARLDIDGRGILKDKVAGCIYTVAHLWTGDPWDQVPCEDCGSYVVVLTSADPGPEERPTWVHCYCDFVPMRRPRGAFPFVCEGVPELVGA